MDYQLTGKYLDGSNYDQILDESEVVSTIDWIFRTANKVHPFASESTIVDYKTLTVEPVND